MSFTENSLPSTMIAEQQSCFVCPGSLDDNHSNIHDFSAEYRVPLIITEHLHYSPCSDHYTLPIIYFLPKCALVHSPPRISKGTTGIWTLPLAHAYTNPMFSDSESRVVLGRNTVIQLQELD